MTYTFREMRADDEEKMQAFYDALGPESTAFFNVNHGNERRTMDFFRHPGQITDILLPNVEMTWQGTCLYGIRIPPCRGSALR